MLAKFGRVVVALGGNAISRPEDDGSVQTDYATLRRSLDAIVDLVESGTQVVLTHGNGPQVGNQMIRVELARGQAPDLPLDIMVADLQGGLGYMIESVLRNKFLRIGNQVPVCTLLTQVEVDPDDPAFGNPTKFVGPFFRAEDVERLATERGWLLREDKGRGWRRVVPSPLPKDIVESGLIRLLVDHGALVIVTGGGGIPVARRPDGDLEGVEGVIDKDYAGAILAEAVGAEALLILTSVERVQVGFGTPEARPLSRITASEGRRLLSEGHFPPGSMGPKMEAACHFVEATGRPALITDIFTLRPALEGETGTWISSDSETRPPATG